MNADKLRELFPRASETFIRANCSTGRETPGAEPQSTVRNEAPREAPREKTNPDRYLVRITSRRCRLQDPDNGCVKAFVDSLRYAQIIPDDTPEAIQLEVRQEKVKSREDEHTLIEVFHGF